MKKYKLYLLCCFRREFFISVFPLFWIITKLKKSYINDSLEILLVLDLTNYF